MEMTVRYAPRRGEQKTASAQPADPDLKARIAAALEDARDRTNWLLDPVDDERLHKQHNRLMSPLVWDAGHVGVYEELWLVLNTTGSAAINEARMHHYDAFDNPRWTRGDLPLMRRDEVREYRDAVRKRALDILDEVDLHGDDPLLANAYVYELVIQHENQHDETLLQALQLLPGGYLPQLPPPRGARPAALEAVLIDAGRYPVGTDSHEPYDNESPRHEVELGAFAIDRFPVTCGQYRGFMEDGGYSRRELWSEKGWAWREENPGIASPSSWTRDGDEWVRDRFGHVEAVQWQQPVMHVCFHEAQAYCRWAGRRLPTEFEWEVAASFDPGSGGQRRYPWGDTAPDSEHANIDQLNFGPAAVGAYPAGASALGCEQMLGDVYEWTSSDFLAYPGYQSFPYPQYSQVFFGGDYKVLRGASWATRPHVARNTFRNWDHPIRRHIFAGFRTATSEN
jgi:gamma-glutamyl hercynylcysteine S-oxide synthase